VVSNSAKRTTQLKRLGKTGDRLVSLFLPGNDERIQPFPEGVSSSSGQTIEKRRATPIPMESQHEHAGSEYKNVRSELDRES
jgi:hypothetical protein